jgi:cobalamin biosynthesis protein CobT
MTKPVEIERWMVHQTALKRAAKDYFLGLKRRKWQMGYTKGRLATSQLYHALDKEPRLFKQRSDSRMINSAVCLLVDSSGSMAGESYQKACASAIMLAETLTMVGVKVEVVGFTDWGTTQLVHEVHCRFGQRINRAELIARMAALGKRLASNSDGENLMLAYDNILKQDVDKRIIIVLSDGQPASQLHNLDDSGYLKAVTSFIEKEGKRFNTEVWGIGISGDETVKRYYTNYALVKDNLLMGEVLLSLVKQAVTLKRS